MKNAAVVLALLSATACGLDPPAATLAARDSAGIMVIESAAPASSSGPIWRIDAAPALDLGVAEGEPELEFAAISGLTRLTDGTIVVADRRASDLRFFDSEGRFLRRVGRAGQGPGEFTQLGRIARFRGDSLAVADAGRRNWHLFDATGRPGRIVTPEDGAALDLSFPPLADGSFLVTRQQYSPGTRGTEPAYSHVSILHLGTDGARLDSVGGFATRLSYETVHDDIPVNMTVLFSPVGVHAASADGFWYGLPQSFEVRDYSADGALRRILRWAASPEPVRNADLDHYIAEASQLWPPEARAGAERVMRDAPVADHFPTFSALLVDTEGALWLREGRVWIRDVLPADLGRAVRWTILGATGEWLGHVELPGELRVFDIGRDCVLGVALDSLDVPHVRLYRLHR